MENSKLIPDENNSINSSPELGEESNKEENIVDQSIDTEIIQKNTPSQLNLENQEPKLNSKSNSIFTRIIENGFDGITSNPNYKMLALLLILLINLSLFLIIGNIGKAFLRKSGIMG